MIDYQTFQQIRQLHDQEHLSAAQIARALDLHEETVSKWIKQPRYERRAWAPQTRRKSKLDPFKGMIVRCLASHPYTAAQLLPRVRDQGYTGGYSILKDFVRTVRPRNAPAFLTLHFAPGQCAQVDWGSWGTLRVGETRRALSFFVLVLCWSRRMYLEFTYSQSQEQWLACHQHAFEFFGGRAPSEIMCDNCKTAVLSHPFGAPALLNPNYADFAAHCGFTVKACGARRANEKGRVENGVAYVKKNFLSGLALSDLASLNAAARVWLDTVANVRVHGETHRTPMAMFAEEQPKLRPLPAYPYDAAVVASVQVSNRCRVVVDTNRYSVPAAYASGQLTAQTLCGAAAPVRRRKTRHRTPALLRAASGPRASRARRCAYPRSPASPRTETAPAIFAPLSPGPAVSRTTRRAPAQRSPSCAQDRRPQ